MLTGRERHFIHSMACAVAGEIRDKVPRYSGGDVGCLLIVVAIGFSCVVAAIWRIEGRLERAGIGVQPKAKATAHP